jgi:predicted ATP-dependent serine protease
MPTRSRHVCVGYHGDFFQETLPMAKAKRLYGCTECGATFPKWAGQCGECGAWNTLVETMIESGGAAAPSGRAGWTGQQAQIKTLAEVSVEDIPRFTTSSTGWPCVHAAWGCPRTSSK